MSSFSGHGAKCVKRRAALSVKANPNCADKADEYVEAAFERCYKDTYPFDRHPNLRQILVSKDNAMKSENSEQEQLFVSGRLSP